MAHEPCPTWIRESDEKLPSVAEGLRHFYDFVARNAKTYPLNPNDIKMWHGKIFKDAVPLPYYAGNFRGTDTKRFPCLAAAAVIVDGSGNVLSSGAPFEQVESEMRKFSMQLRDFIEKTDQYTSQAKALPDRLRAAVQLAAFCHGSLVRIHPFMNGNGRMSRITADYFLRRYGFPFAFWPPLIRPGLEYERAAHECMNGKNRPLYEYLLRTMVSQIKSLSGK